MTNPSTLFAYCGLSVNLKGDFDYFIFFVPLDKIQDSGHQKQSLKV